MPELSSIPQIRITEEMIKEAKIILPRVRVYRTQASEIDTLTGILGEFAFAQYFYGDWRKHNVGVNKGKTDFGDIEIKTSAFPFNNRLNLLVREDYAIKRKPRFYIQIIIDVPNTTSNQIEAGTTAYICGFATSEEVDNAPKRDFGSKFGGRGGYMCNYIPITKLHNMGAFKEEYRNV